MFYTGTLLFLTYCEAKRILNPSGYDSVKEGLCWWSSTVIRNSSMSGLEIDSATIKRVLLDKIIGYHGKNKIDRQYLS